MNAENVQRNIENEIDKNLDIMTLCYIWHTAGGFTQDFKKNQAEGSTAQSFTRCPPLPW